VTIEPESQLANQLRRGKKRLQQASRSGRWVFVEWKTAHCRDCGTFLSHSWNYSIGSTEKGSLCTVCVAPHIWIRHR
jgi:RNase P subunit RPR2